MSGNLPFGFTPPGDGDDSGGGSGGSGVPGPMGFGPGGFDMSQLGEALQQLGRMMASGGGDAGPVNWDLARDGARQHVAQEGDPSVNATERREVEAALDLASLWLDPATSFPATSSGGGAWSRSEWIEATLPQWKRIVEPVAIRANESMAGFMPTGGGLPEGLPPELARRVAERKTRANLSAREIDVLGLIARGKANKEIAAALALSEATVKTHIAHILDKLDAPDRTRAVTIALERGLLRL